MDIISADGAAGTLTQRSLFSSLASVTPLAHPYIPDLALGSGEGEET